MSHKKPASLRILEGNRGHRPINRNELIGIGEPVPPACLTREQLERWHEIVASLPRGLLTAADTSILERMAVAWAMFRETTAAINEAGMLVPGQRGENVKNPLCTVRRMATDEMQVCGAALGLSPQARMRLVNPSEPDDPMAVLCGAWRELPE
jgi:P27 family predicted phage terminase small subunit